MPRIPRGKTNPFRYGDIVTGNLFTDRQDELAALETDVRSGQNVVLLSPRGIAAHYVSFSIGVCK